MSLERLRVAILGNHESVHVTRWMDEMTARGIDSVVLSEHKPGDGREWRPIAVPSWVPAGAGLRTRALGRSVRKAFRDAGCDVLHTHYIGGYAYAADASGVRPRVCTVWGSDILRMEDKSDVAKKRTRRALRHADIVTCDSTPLLDAAVELGALRDRCVMISWGADTSLFKPDDAARTRIRAFLGIPEDALVAMSGRHLRELYRVESIVRAAAEASRREPRFRLLVTGEGDQREALEELAEKTAPGIVIFTGRLADEQAMAQHLAASDCYVSVPTTDGGSVSILEAMSAGLPVVASDIPANREWVEPSKTGALWSGEDPVALADEMLEVLHSGGEMRASARQVILERGDRAKEMARMAEVYRSLVR